MGGKSILRTRQKGKKAPTVAKLKKTAWKLLSECIRRESDRYRTPSLPDAVECYTCAAMHPWKEIQAGHAIGGRTGSVLLDEELIRPQCARCNIWLRGNYQVFIPKLIREREVSNPYGIGLDWWETKLQSARQIKKWSRSDLQEKIDNYKARLNGL